MRHLRIKRSASRCHDCPLSGMTKVYGIADEENPKIVVIGEAPGEVEDSKGEPFTGPAGRWLYSAIDAAGLKNHKVYKTNYILCRPPKNNITSDEAEIAMECCRPGFIEEMRDLIERGVRVFVPVGNIAMEALGIEGSITKNRGSVYLTDKEISGEHQKEIAAIPTFHPSYIMRGQVKEEPVWIGDFVKAKRISRNGWEAPREKFNIFPSIVDVRSFRDRVVKGRYPIGVDIETTSLNPEKGKIWCIGMSTSSEEAIVIPFYKQGGGKYWSSAMEDLEVRNAVDEILKKCPTIYQNALFDVRYLRYHGYNVGNIADDTMLLHHSISPELKHNLGFLVSVYGETPYWKDIVLNSEEKIRNQDDETFRTYNARDAVVLHQILPSLKDDLRELGAGNIYENISKPLIWPVMDMTDNGIYLDVGKQRKFKKELKERADELYKEMSTIGAFSDKFNIDSPDDQRFLFHAKVPSKYKRAKKELEKYEEEGSRLKKNTKKYQNLVDTVSAFEGMKPLYQTDARVKRTASGLPGTDGEALLQIQVAANNRYRKIEKFRRPKESHEQEKAQIQTLIDFIKAFKEYKDTTKLLSTFTDYPVGEDGRVHFNFKIHGTATGRLSSGGKGTAGNAQNIPKKAKKIFSAEPGNVLIQADYSNLELRVLAYEADDDVLQDTFARGENVHTANCKLLFAIDESHPTWDIARRASKIYIFGRNYGGSLRGVFEKVVKEVPDLKLTYSRFEEIDKTYRDAHPKYAAWYDETVRKVKSERKLTNAFGRVRYFNGTDSEIVREGLNFPIQSLAADIMNMSFIGMYKDFCKNSHLEARVVGTVHDSLIVESPRKNQKKVIRVMKDNMEKSYNIRGTMVSFPVDFEVGDNWAELEEVEI